MNMIEKRKAMAGQGGFTLIELLVVIAILAVLGGAAIIGIGALRGSAQEEVCKTDRETIELAAEAKKVADNLDDYTTITEANLVSDNYLKKDPKGTWAINGTSGAATVSGSAYPAAVVTACNA